MPFDEAQKKGGLQLPLMTSNFRPLTDNPRSEEEDGLASGPWGAAESSGGGQMSLTSLPFFFRQLFITRKRTDVQTPNSRGIRPALAGEQGPFCVCVLAFSLSL